MVQSRKDYDQSEDFDRLSKISEYFENEEFQTNGSLNHRQASSYDGDAAPQNPKTPKPQNPKIPLVRLYVSRF